MNGPKASADLLQVLIITRDEEPNIERTLDKLGWAEKVVVVDSLSTDATVEILRSYPNVEVHEHPFETFAKQCNYGLSLMTCKWVLSLDADFVLTNEFIEETLRFVNDKESKKVAYFTRFKFLVFGKKLDRNNTTQRAVLFKKADCVYFDDGHAHRLKIDGRFGHYSSYILHDDRKSLNVWLSNQDKYSIREADKLLGTGSDDNLSWTARIRRTKILAPFIVFFYCLFAKGLIFKGWYGWHYTLQRTFVEMLFALRLIENTKFKDELPN